jgi:hypothetical protein
MGDFSNAWSMIGDLEEAENQKQYQQWYAANEEARFKDYQRLLADQYQVADFRKTSLYPQAQAAWNKLYSSPETRLDELTARNREATRTFDNLFGGDYTKQLTSNADLLGYTGARSNQLLKDIYSGEYGNRLRSNVQPLMDARLDAAKVGGKQAAMDSLNKTLGQMEQKGIRDSYSANRMRFDANYTGAANEAAATASAKFDNARMMADINNQIIANQYASLGLPAQLMQSNVAAYGNLGQLALNPYTTLATIESAPAQQLINEINLRNSLMPMPGSNYVPFNAAPYASSGTASAFANLGAMSGGGWSDYNRVRDIINKYSKPNNGLNTSASGSLFDSSGNFNRSGSGSGYGGYDYGAGDSWSTGASGYDYSGSDFTNSGGSLFDSGGKLL